jgi:hypothetical protein
MNIVRMDIVGFLCILSTLSLEAIASEDLFLTLSDDVDAVIETEHILITDLSQSSGDALMCWSTRVHKTFRWYHQFIGSEELTELPIITENKPSYFGWKSGIGREFGYNTLTLLKEMDTIPIEGIFTCNIGGSVDIGNFESVSVGMHYPSKIFLSVELIHSSLTAFRLLI